MRGLRSLLVAFGCGIAIQGAVAANGAFERLQAMAVAVNTQPYSGKLVYQRADVLANLVFQHDVVDGQTKARLRRLSGSPLERSRSGSQLFEATPGPDIMRQGHPLPGLIRLETDLLINAPYQFALAGEERVADRQAQVVTVDARDTHRHSYRFWVDVDSDLLLRAQTLNADNQILEQFEFSEVSLEKQDIPLASDNVSLQIRVHPIATPGEVMQFTPASWLPNGYQLVAALPLGVSGQSDYTLVYSDGLGSFSLFLELVSTSAGPDMQALIGPTVALARDYPLASGALRVTLVGEIPASTGASIIRALDVDGLQGLLNRGS